MSLLLASPRVAWQFARDGAEKWMEQCRRWGLRCQLLTPFVFAHSLSFSPPLLSLPNFDFDLTAPSSLPSLSTYSSTSIHLCRPTPTGFSLWKSRRIGKPASRWQSGRGSSWSHLRRRRCSDNRSKSIICPRPGKTVLLASMSFCLQKRHCGLQITNRGETSRA